MSGRSRVATPVHMGEVEKGVCGTTWVAAVNGALENVDRAGIQVCSRASVGHRCQFQVVSPLLSSTASVVSAVGDSIVIDLRPSGATIRALPNALIILSHIYVPDIHLIAAGDNRELSSVNWTRRG